MSMLTLLLPELVLSVSIVFLLLADVTVFRQSIERSYRATVGFILPVVFIMLILQHPAAETGVLLQQYHVDPLAKTIKLLLVASLWLCLFWGRPQQRIAQTDRSEFYILALFSLLGMMILSSANHLLMLYLGLELFALPLYGLVVLSAPTTAEAPESAIKYFVMGGVSTGIMLYGISLLYGLTGHLDFPSILSVLSGDNLLGLTAALCLLVGVAFKFGAVPFHMWMPDVYQASGARLTLFVATTSKIAAFLLAYRVLVCIFPDFSYTKIACLGIATLSLLVGNFVAVLQTKIKRLLAYSTIAQVGFVFLAFGTDAKFGMSAALFYVLTYVLASLSAFGVLLMLTRNGREIASVDDLRGLGEAHPRLAFVMLISVFSMAGIPPTVGFYAKLLVFQALMLQGYLGLVIFALLASVVAAYYYLRIIKVMYFESMNEAGHVGLTRVGEILHIGLLNICAVSLLVFGVLPSLLHPLCVYALGLT